MNIFVETAVPLDQEASALAGSLAAPRGFPFLVAEANDSLTIVEPASIYLCRKFLFIRAREARSADAEQSFRRNSARACADDLKDWWEFLCHEELLWDRVRREDVEQYRDTMLQTVSPRTHEPYARATVRRRLTTVIDFYRWAARERKYAGDLEGDSLRQITRSIDRRPLAHLSSGGGKSNDLLPSLRRGVDDLVRAMRARDYRAIACRLGPVPSERGQDPRPARDRLAAELSLHTGMRIDEVTSLTKWQLLDLIPDRERPLTFQLMPITKTKGLRPRRVMVPNWLIAEVHAYIDGERKEALAEGTRRGLKREPQALFLNGVTARHNAGRPLSNDSLDEMFRRAVIDAGLTESTHKTDPETGERYIVQTARYSFHCLRHSFAIWRYYAERQAGNTEPWKLIQSLLGHQSLATTTDLYLRVSGEFEAQVSDRVSRYFDAIRHE